MKINLTLNGPILNGYINLDPLAQIGQTERIPCDPTNLDGLVDNNEVENFIAENVLDYLPLQIRPKTLLHWTSKLTHGGTITVTGTNIPELVRLIHRGDLSDVITINKALYGTGTNIWTIKKSYVSPEDTVNILMQSGQLETVMVKIAGIAYVITMKRK